MSNFTNLDGGIDLELIRFDKFNANIPAAEVPSGPLVTMSDLQEDSTKSFYLPSGETFEDVDETKKNGISLLGDKIYLNYYGVTVTTSLDRNENRQLAECRDFRI